MAETDNWDGLCGQNVTLLKLLDLAALVHSGWKEVCVCVCMCVTEPENVCVLADC